MTIQIRTNGEMQIKLMGATLTQSQKIEEFLRLEWPSPDTVNKVDEKDSPSGNQPSLADNKSEPPVVDHGYQDETVRTA